MGCNWHCNRLGDVISSLLDGLAKRRLAQLASLDRVLLSVRQRSWAGGLEISTLSLMVPSLSA